MEDVLILQLESTPAAGSRPASCVAPRKQQDRRLLELDVLRGIAAMGVVLCHYTSECVSAGRLSSTFTYGAFGPHIFFIISGFVILMTLEKTRHAADFLVSRASRLYPAYWTAIVFTVAVRLVLPTAEPLPSPPQIAANLTMFQTWLGAPDLNVVYWTLAVELRFYAMMFLVYLFGGLKEPRARLMSETARLPSFRCPASLGKRLSQWFSGVARIEVVTIAWLVGSVLLAVWGESFNSAAFKPLRLLLIPGYGQLFIAGIMFWRIRTRGRSFVRLAILAACFAAQCLVSGGSVAPVVCVACFFVAFGLFVYGRLAWIVRRPLVLLGTISYSLYLVHQVVGAVTIPRLAEAIASPLVLIAIPCLVSVAVAATTTWGIERPAMRRIRCYWQPNWRVVEAVPPPA
jgi:peptidoglycan/LPS O-acetylase OafA/YrhL